jgi:hypothetical protein
MIKKYIHRFSALFQQVNFLYEKQGQYDGQTQKFLSGKIMAELTRDKPSMNDAEFQVFSQFGDDGIIQWLVSKIDCPKTFIEFGVEDYRESNTRFLLLNNNWSGLVIEANQQAVNYIKADPVSMYHDLTAVHSFVTKSNINTLIDNWLQMGYSNEIGILSIDIDGNDWWIWNEIIVIKPIIVIVEYNSVMGEKPWTIPYQNDFRRTNTQYWGASLKAFEILANRQGYSLIGCNNNGNNAYFLRNDCDKSRTLKRSFQDAYRLSKIREDRKPVKERFSQLQGKEVLNVITNQIEII